MKLKLSRSWIILLAIAAAVTIYQIVTGTFTFVFP